MTSPPAVRHIPLDKLVPSPTNVRKTPPSAAEDAELKASIRARGLKQNLVVHPSSGEKGMSRRDRRRPPAQGVAGARGRGCHSAPISGFRAWSRRPRRRSRPR